ncbi:hypothetical protein BJ878DRAFT_520954 [Calycina marina]|uniref:Uncharacterized protein n=1 Tax=Calycina marina TaxID=1763456 RepID=A0A9P7YXA1_9HELO|nr:hypothetical protein BJ878DRAFT_520954 [Calycina marina]
MAPLLEDPRFRQTWNQISQNAETATQTAAAGIWAFQHSYITPCFTSIASGFEQCAGNISQCSSSVAAKAGCECCLNDREDRGRRRNARGRAEANFDFYDDWDEDISAEAGGLLGGWANDELDRLLAGSGSYSGPIGGIKEDPGRKMGMSYGTRGRKKTLEADPTIIPSTSAFGFLGRLPFKLGGTLRYKPSAADLQEHLGIHGLRDEEGEALLGDEQDNESGEGGKKGHRRNRSDTASSGGTSDSFRSRRDLFPSDGEDDAVPLDDEFAMVLERRFAGDDQGSGKTGRSSKGKRPVAGRNFSSRNMSAGTHSERSRPSLDGKRMLSGNSMPMSFEGDAPNMVQTPSLDDLYNEEERLRQEEDAEVDRKREAAANLARERGLSAHASEDSENTIKDSKGEHSEVQNIDLPAPSVEVTTDEEFSCGRDEPEHDPKSDFVPARLPHFS